MNLQNKMYHGVKIMFFKIIYCLINIRSNRPKHFSVNLNLFSDFEFIIPQIFIHHHFYFASNVVFLYYCDLVFELIHGKIYELIITRNANLTFKKYTNRLIYVNTFDLFSKQIANTSGAQNLLCFILIVIFLKTLV